MNGWTYKTYRPNREKGEGEEKGEKWEDERKGEKWGG